MDPIDIKPAGLVAGIDDSDQALSVARVALGLASELGLGLTLVHIAHHEKHYLVGEKRRDVLERGARLLRNVAKQAGLRGHARLRVELGDPATELLDVASEVEAQVLVVGSRGRGPLRSSLLGSVSQQAIAGAACPVVVVPPALSPDWDGIESIVVGIDDADASDSAAAWAGALSRRLGARLVLVHVAQDPALASAASGFDLPGGQYKQMLDAERQSAFALLLRAASQIGRPPRVELVSEVGDPAAEIHRLTVREHAGMIIVGSAGRGGLHRAVHGGLSRRLVAHAGCPVAVISGGIPGRTITAPGAEANGRKITGATDLVAETR